MFDLVVKGGTIVDGARNPRYRADIAIENGRIRRIGRVERSEAVSSIDASDLIVAPGFIDLHTHYDAQLFWDPFLSNSGWHGVTTAVTGNCGFGFAPTRSPLRDRAMLSMTRIEQIPLESLRTGLPWDWETFPEYVASVRRTPMAVNVLPLVPLNPLLIWVLGLEDAKAGKRPSSDDHRAMVALLGDALDHGAAGWSAQCKGVPGQPELGMNSIAVDFDGTPMPTDVMWPETRAVLADVLGRRGTGFIQMTSLAGNDTIGYGEWEHLAELSGRPMIYNALTGSELSVLANQRRELIEWLRTCQQRGLPIFGHAITADTPLLFTLENFDSWAFDPTWRELSMLVPDAKAARLRDPAVRARLRDIEIQSTSGYSDVVLQRTTSDDYSAFAGRRIGDIARDLGCHPLDAILDIALADGLRAEFIVGQFHTELSGLRELLEYEYLLPGISDGGAHIKRLPGGQYTTEFIANFVREHAILSLEEAHWRLSGLPAFVAGLGDRGTIREGLAADLVIYALDELRCSAPEFAQDLPGGQWRVVSRGQGYRYVVVNGMVTREGDRETGVRPGSLVAPAKRPARNTAKTS